MSEKYIALTDFHHEWLSESECLLVVKFRDTDGKRYRWVPKWRDVRCLIADAIVTEGDNSRWRGGEIWKFQKLTNELELTLAGRNDKGFIDLRFDK